MLTQILDWIDNVAIGFLVASVVIWALYRRKMPSGITYVGIYLLLNLLVQIGAYFLWKQSLNNLPLLHLNTLLEFVFFSLFFREIYIGQPWFKKNAKYIIAGISLLLVLNSLFLESLTDFNSNAKILVQVCLISYVILYFFDAFGRVDFSFADTQAISFICFAVLMYYAGSLFIFMFKYNSFRTAEIAEGYRLIWVINGILNAIFQLIVLIAFSKIVLSHKGISD